MAAIKSVEEKAKAYEEAVIRGSRLWESDMITRENYEYIFPELKESEDERIRGNIIATIHLYYGEPLDDEAKEMIAWLEKQGEQNPYGQRQECIDCQFNYAGECKGSCAMKRSEQKPAETEKGAKGNEREIPISAWSEEDEARFESCIKVLQTSDGYDTINAKWFKSLKDRVQPQPKQEWSEEDEMFVHGLIRGLTAKRDIHGHTTFSSDNIDITKTIDWLKNLKERYTWKPSNEQIKVCKEVYADLLSAKGFDLSTVNGELNRLEEELKKLREE